VKARVLAALLLALALGLVIGPDRAAAAGPPVPHCTPAPEDCTGWFRTNVTVQWTWDSGGIPENCSFQTITTDTAGTTVSCTVSFNGTPFPAGVTIRRDATPPQVKSVAPARPPDANGWYNHAVAIVVTGSDATSGIASCTSPTYAGPDGASRDVSGTCTDVAGNTSAPTVAALKYDETPPSVTAAPGRDPDAGGWYNHAVAITAVGTDPVSGVASCTTPSYSGPDSPTASVSATCTDTAGNTSAPVAVTLKFDSTAPTVSASADRPPDGGEWYRSPLRVTFSGGDATSGIASCTAPTDYKGPDGSGVTVSGSCKDAAGNNTDTTLDFNYDSTAPSLASLTATGSKGLVRLGWQTSDAVSTELVRTPGLKGAKSSVVYRGKGRSFADKSVQNGRRYRYELRVADTAGNVARRTVAATPRPPLYKPALNAVVRAPLTLGWDATDARFYNVQVLRNGLKVLSAWPRTAKLVLHSSWRFEGKTYALEPGRYRWYVWGARGTREKPNYGRPLGTSTFVVKSP
jgi:hypothetical protein